MKTNENKEKRKIMSEKETKIRKRMKTITTKTQITMKTKKIKCE